MSEEKNEFEEKDITEQINDQIQKPLNVEKLIDNKPQPEQHKAKKSIIFTSLLCGLLGLTAGITGGYLIGKKENQITDPNLIKIIECYKTLNNGWFYGKTDADVSNIVTDLMLNSFQDTDPYTFYTSTMAGQNLSTDGKGLGIEAYYVPQGVLVKKAYKKSAWTNAGGKTGDIITGVKIGESDFDFGNMLSKNISEKMNIARNAKNTYHVLRGEETLDLEVKIDKYSEDIAWLVLDEVIKEKRTVVIRIDTFMGSPYTIVSDILKELQDVHNPIESLVFDLRDNGGGYIDQMCKLACLFAPKGSTIYVAKDREGRVVEKVTQQNQPTYTIPEIKFVLNHGSASATEAFALSLMGNNDAKSYGYRSYGKGIAQTFFTFNDGSVLRYTYAQTYGPQNMSIHGEGIVPENSFNDYYHEVPYNYHAYMVDAGSLDFYGSKIGAYLNYLGYTITNYNPEEVLRVANLFQADYGYEVSSSYTEFVTREIIYEIYKSAQKQYIDELNDVIDGVIDGSFDR